MQRREVRIRTLEINIHRPFLMHSSDACLFDVHLPKSLKRGETSNLVMETVETSATTAFPKFAAQNDDQSLKYRTNLLIQSPYKTLTQRTKFKSV